MTSETFAHRYGVPVLTCAPDGPPLTSGGQVVDLIGEALHRGAELVVVPASRLPDEFFTLRTGQAGEIVQKFVNYRLRLVVVGDLSDRVAVSPTLRAFVNEANRGRQTWFVTDAADLDRRLQRERAAGVDPRGRVRPPT